MPPRRFSALHVAAGYAIISLAYIAWSDRLIEQFVSDLALLTWLQTLKGSAFVALTAVGLFLVLRREFALRDDARRQVEQHADVLESRVAERTAALEASNAALRQFSYSVSHDLRAPLRTLEGFAEMLKEDYGDRLGPPGIDLVERIGGSVQRMDRLTRELLTYSRLSSAPLDVGSVDLDVVASDVLDQLTRQVVETGAHVDVQTPLGVVQSNQVALHQVLFNFVSNALKFVPPGEAPRVRILAADGHGTRRLIVEDHGIGVPAGQAARLFGVFERLHDAQVYDGVGMGLALAHKAAERLGQTVGYEPNPAGGSRFWITLPPDEPPFDAEPGGRERLHH